MSELLPLVISLILVNKPWALLVKHIKDLCGQVGADKGGSLQEHQALPLPESPCFNYLGWAARDALATVRAFSTQGHFPVRMSRAVRSLARSPTWNLLLEHARSLRDNGGQRPCLFPGHMDGAVGSSSGGTVTPQTCTPGSGAAPWRGPARRRAGKRCRTAPPAGWPCAPCHPTPTATGCWLPGGSWPKAGTVGK